MSDTPKYAGGDYSEADLIEHVRRDGNARYALSHRQYVTNTDTTVTMHFKVPNQVFAAMKALAALAPAIVRSEPRKPAKRVAIEPKATPRPDVDLVGPGAPRK